MPCLPSTYNTPRASKYPTISEVRRKLNGMLAGRPAESPPTTQEQTDVIDGCDAEIALWVQEALEEAADMAADELVGDRLSEKQAALDPPEFCDESDEEEERINHIRKADKEEALADGADDTVDEEWNSVVEPDMMDFGLWTKVNAPGVNVDKVEPAPPTEREKAEEADIDDITTVKTAEIEEFLGMSLDDDKDKRDDDEEMPDYGADDGEVEVIEEDDEEEKPSAGEKRKPEGLPESSSVGAAPNVATKKMPKPVEREQRRKVQKIVKYDDTHEKDIPLQLQPGLQSYIGPEHMLKVPVPDGRPVD